MAENSMQPIEGAGLLSSLKDLFFKGLDKVLDKAAEYQEEMGVLKQVNKIPIQDINGENSYTLTIKLSPVRGKDSTYYVEAETDAPNLDVSKLDEQAMKIDKSTKTQFKNIIDKMLADSKYSASMDRSDESNDEEIEENKKHLSKELKNSDIIAQTVDGKSMVVVRTALVDNKDNSVDIDLSVYDIKGNVIKEFKPKTYTLYLVDEGGNVLEWEEFYNMVKDRIQQYLDDNDLEVTQSNIFTSTKVSVTFIKNGKEVSLTAVKASSDIDDSMELVYELADDPEFVDQLVDGKEASFEITDNGEEFEVDTINNVDQSESYIDFYKEVSKVYVTFRVVESMLGSDKVRQDSFFNACYWALSDIQNKAAEWVSNDANINPILQDPFQIIPTVEQYRNIGEDTEVAKARLAEDINKAMDRFNFLAVNLSGDDQLSVDCWINRMDQILAYK